MKNLIRWIIIFTILVVIIIFIVKLVQDSKIGTNASERQLIIAGQKYYSQYPNLLPRYDYETRTVSSNALISSGFLKQTVDMYGAPKSCESYVTITKVGAEYFYNPFVKCGIKDDTLLLYDKLVSMSKNESKDGTNGIFRFGDRYVYRGDIPQNFVTFAGKLWRIMEIDSDRHIKMFYDGDFAESKVWDNRYNPTVGKAVGINDYQVSRIRDYLLSYLGNADKFSNKSKAKLAYMNLCVSPRDLTNLSVDGSLECIKRQGNQLIGLPTVSEFLNASNDPNCPKDIRACSNYNFMARVKSFWTMTPVLGTTEKVYRVFTDEGLIERDAISEHFTYPVVALKPDVAILSGEGTFTNPYVLK